MFLLLTTANASSRSFEDAIFSRLSGPTLYWEGYAVIGPPKGGTSVCRAGPF